MAVCVFVFCLVLDFSRINSNCHERWYEDRAFGSPPILFSLTLIDNANMGVCQTHDFGSTLGQGSCIDIIGHGNCCS
jgi:hypothetical protein